MATEYTESTHSADDDQTSKPAGSQKQSATSNKTPGPLTVKKTEQDPAVERGERLDAGKQIARSGKQSGTVPGAEPSK